MARSTGKQLLISGQKDGRLVKEMLAVYGPERLRELWKRFLTSKDEFVLQAGYSIGVFRSQANKLNTATASGSRHIGFAQRDYAKGANGDGRF